MLVNALNLSINQSVKVVLRELAKIQLRYRLRVWCGLLASTYWHSSSSSLTLCGQNKHERIYSCSKLALETLIENLPCDDVIVVQGNKACENFG